VINGVNRAPQAALPPHPACDVSPLRFAASAPPIRGFRLSDLRLPSPSALRPTAPLTCGYRPSVGYLLRWPSPPACVWCLTVIHVRYRPFWAVLSL